MINIKNRAAKSALTKHGKTFRLLSTSMLTAGLVVAAGSSPALAGHPWDFKNVAGNFDTDTSQEDSTTIYGHSPVSIGEGNTSILQGQVVNVIEDSSRYLFTAKDNTGDPSLIIGALHSNGRVMIIDRNGVFFGKDSIVDVNAILVSTGDISNADLLDGDDKFHFSNFGPGKIELNGKITVAQAGIAAFVSPFVTNNGVINAKMGKVAFAAGDKVTLDLYGDDLIEIAVNDKLANALLENKGKINAEGGQVLMTAQAAKDAVDNVINLDGVVKVGSIEQEGGKIILKGGEQGTVNVAGTLDASGNGGGNINVTGQNVHVASTASLSANGGKTGKGGRVSVFAGDTAIIEGKISARGGSESGDGGFIETSGANLGVSNLASIDAAATNGANGEWLLDPLSIAITSGSGPTVTISGQTYTRVSSAAVSSTLTGGTNVTVQTGVDSAFTAGGTNNNEGDIHVRNSIINSGSNNATLNLIAGDDIFVENGADILATGSGKLDVNLTAGNSDPQGDISFVTGSNLTTNGGGVVFNATGDTTIGGMAITTNGGNVDINTAGKMTITLNGDIFAGGGNIAINNGGIFSSSDTDTLHTSGTGTITVNQKNGGKIQKAVNAIDNTGTGLNTINVGAGTYNEDVAITENNFKLIGANAGIAGSGVRGAETIVHNTIGAIGKGFGFKVTSNNVTIDGFKIDTDGAGVWLEGGAGGISGATIQNNLIDTIFNIDTSDEGIRGRNASNVLAQNNQVTTTDNDAISFIGGGNVTVSNNVVIKTDNHGAYDGIHFDSVTGAVIDGNTVDNTTDDGIFVTNSAGAQVTNNKIGLNSGVSHVQGDGIDVENSAGANISGNQIANVNGYGVFLDPSDNSVISGNVINNTALDGIAVIDSANVTIANNEIGLLGAAGSIGSGVGGGDGIFVTNSDGATIQGNKTANTHYNGPARKGSGILVTNSDNVQIGGAGALGNDIALAGSDGIVIRTDGGTADHDTVEGNTIHGAAGSRTGVYTEFATNATIKDNTINGTGRYAAIFANGGSNQTITGNILNHNDEEGILVWNAGGVNLIDGNHIDNTGENKKSSDGTNSGDGIHVENTAGLTISNNQIGQNGGNINGNGIFVDPSDGAIISGNYIDFAAGNSIDVENSDNVQILNNNIGQISGGFFTSGDGIHVDGGSDNADIENNTISSDGHAIALIGGDSHVVKNNTASTVFFVNTDDSGIFALNTTNVDIEGNSVLTADNSGIVVSSGSNATVKNNNVDETTDVPGDGIDIFNVTTALVDGNVVHNTIGHGIYANDTSGLTISNNWVGYTDNLGTAGASGNIGVDGVHVEDLDGAQINSNHVINTVGNGIFVDPTNNAVISGNTVDNAGTAGIRVSGGDSNTISNNTVSDSGTTNIFGDVGSNLAIYGNTSNGSFYGIYGADLSGNSYIESNVVNDAGANGITVTGSSGVSVGVQYPTGVIPGNQFEGGNTVNNSGQVGIEVGGGANNIVGNNTVNGAGSDGIYVHDTDNADVDTNEVYGAGSGYNGGNGINLQNVTTGAYVFNNYVHDISDTPDGVGENNGILANNVAGLTITVNTIGGNVNGDGIDVENSGGAQITSNAINGVAGNGIFLDPSDNAVISGNTIDFATLNGIDVENSDNVDVTSNVIGSLDGGQFGDGSGDGIHVAGGSDGAFVDNNTVTTDGRGIALIGGDNHEVSNNTITTISWFNGADEGIYAEDTNGANIHNNHVTTADNAGIRALGGSNITVNANDIHAATEQGIDVEGLTNAIVTNNSVENTFSHGIDVENTSGLTLTGNWVGYSDTAGTVGGAGNIGGDGIHVVNASGSLIGSNHVINTLGNGIFVDPTDNALIISNVVNNAALAGIEVSGGTGNMIWYNTVNNSGTANIFGNVGTNLSIYGNTVSGSFYGIYGADLDGASIISLNTVDGAGVNGITVSGSSNVVIGGTDGIIPGHQGDSGNYVSNSGENGIEVSGGTGNIISNNSVWNFGHDGIYAHDTDNVQITINEAYAGGYGYFGGNGIDAQNITNGAYIYYNLIHDISDATTVYTDASATNNGIFAKNVAGLNVTSNGVGYTDIFSSNTPDDSLSINGDGIHVEDSASAQINSNLVQQVAGNGIFLDPSDNSTISYNTVDYVGLNGIDVENSDGVQVLNNQVGIGSGGTGIDNGDGIHVGGGSDSSNVDGNNVMADGRGISILGGDSHTVNNNTVSTIDFFDGVDEGIYAEDTSNSDITNNTVTTADNSGIVVNGGSNATVTGNTVNATTDFLGNGIEIDGVETALVDSNVIQNTLANGIFAEDTTGLTISGNWVGYSAASVLSPGSANNIGGDGIHVIDSGSAQITSNHVINVAGNGVFVDPSPATVIQSNNISNSGLNGINLQDSAGSTIDYNTVNNSTLDGIHLEDSANTEIDGNMVVTAGGNGIYVLNSDGTHVGDFANGNSIDYATGHGVDVENSDGVKVISNIIGFLSGGFFTSGDGIHVDNGSDSSDIEANDISTDGRGIALIGGDSHFVSDNRISTVSFTNTVDEGIFALNTTNVDITGNHITTADNSGIVVTGGSNATVTGNDVDATVDFPGNGIEINSVDTALVDGNFVADTLANGIFADDVTGLTISNNWVGYDVWFDPIGGITLDGIHVVDSGGASITGNHVSGVGGNGIFVDPSPNTLIQENTIDGSGLNGISLADSIDSNIVENTVTNSTLDGIHVENSAGTEINENTVNTAGGNGIYVLNSDNVDIGGLDSDNDDDSDESGNTINYVVGNGIDVENSDNVDVKNNTIGNLDGGAFGGGSGDGIHVAGGSDGAFVDNNTVTSDGRGVSLLGGDGHEVSNNTITTISWINSDDEGIYAESTSNANIHDNHVTSADNAGIRVSGGSDATVNNNDIHAATEQGIDIESVDTASVTNNFVENVFSDGIFAYNTSGLTVSGNVIQNTGDDGIDVEFSDGAQVTNNWVGYSSIGTPGSSNNITGDGIDLIDSADASVSFNNITNVEGNGIFIDPSPDVLVQENNISNSGLNGIDVESGSDNVNIVENTVTNSALDGIHVTGSDNVEINENTVSDSGYYGIFVSDTNRVDIGGLDSDNDDDADESGNNVSDSGIDGIHVEDFGTANIVNNTVDESGDDGIEAVDGDNVFIANNTVTDSGVGSSGEYGGGDYYGADGIHVRDVGYFGYFGSDFAVDIENNTVDISGDDGIEVLDSGRTLIEGNTISHSGADGYYFGLGDYSGADGIHVAGVYNDGYFAGGSVGGYFSGYTVNIIGNTVDQSGDDGIEVTDSGSTLIMGNHVTNSGVSAAGYFEGYFGGGGYYLGGGDYTGADGIHVSDVYSDNGYSNAGNAGNAGDSGTGEIFPYAVVIDGNTVDQSADDGIEVADSGRTLVRGNTVSNSGVGGYFAPDGWGADGIHVRDVHADDEDTGIGYDVEVSGNTITNSDDDGIEVVYDDLDEGSPAPKFAIETVGGDFGGPTTNVGVLGNTVSDSGDNGIVVTNANFVMVDKNSVANSGNDGVLVDTESFGYFGYFGGYFGFEGFDADELDASNFPNQVTITNNQDVTDSGNNGIEVNGYGQIEVGNNIVTDSGHDGVLVTNLLSGGFVFDEPVFDSFVSLISVSNDPNVFIHDNSVTNSGTDGIHVDSFLDDGTSTVTVTDNAVTNSGENALDVAGPDNGVVTVSGNAFENFDVGARFESGLIDLTGDTNFFFGGNVGLLFSPYDFGEGSFAPLSLVDDDAPGSDTVGGTFPPTNFGGTIGHQFFSGQSTFFVELANGAFFEPGEPTILNGLNSTYDGITPSDTGGILDQASFDFLESKFFHFPDDGSLGLFWFGFVPNNPNINQSLIFNQFDAFNGHVAGLNITVLGLPTIPGANGAGGNLSPGALNAIQTFAGGESDGSLSPEDLNKIETAAGDDGNGGKKAPAHCWNEAMNAAYSGQTVNYSFGGTTEDAIAGAAACGGGSL